jgi:hypothetical protein
MKTYVLFIIILSFITFSCTNNFSNGEEFMKQSKYEEAVDAFSLVPENDENFKKSQYLSKISENYIIITKIKKLDYPRPEKNHIDNLKDAKTQLSSIDNFNDSLLLVEISKLNKSLDRSIKQSQIDLEKENKRKKEQAEIKKLEMLWIEESPQVIRKSVARIINRHLKKKNWISWTYWQQMSAPDSPFYNCSDLTFFIQDNNEFTLARTESNWSAVGWAYGTWVISTIELFNDNDIKIKYNIERFGNLWNMDKTDIEKSFKYCDEANLKKLLINVLEVPEQEYDIERVISSEKEKFLRKNGGWRKYKHKL